MANDDLVFEVVRLVPVGRVTTYGVVARLTGLRPRIVGQILHRNPRPQEIPCHRVVLSSGRLASGYAFGGLIAQQRKLANEGVRINGGRLNLAERLFVLTKVLGSYFELLKRFGQPPVWPWSGAPAHSAEEIAIGAILTQRTSWRNVEMALNNLRRARVNNLRALQQFVRRDRGELENLIRPSGFYRQKAECLLTLAQTLKQTGGWQKWQSSGTADLRTILLDLKGIGPETADTILLYALGRPVFVIDEYTRRFTRHHRLTQVASYDDLQQFFTNRLPLDIKLYQSYHALIVLWGKNKKSPTSDYSSLARP